MTKGDQGTIIQTGCEAEIEIGWPQIRFLFEQSLLRSDNGSPSYHDLLLFSITEEEMEIFAIDPSRNLKTHLNLNEFFFGGLNISGHRPVKALVDGAEFIDRLEVIIKRRQQGNRPPGDFGTIKLQFMNRDEYGFTDYVTAHSRYELTADCQPSVKMYQRVPQRMRLGFLKSGSIQLEDVQYKESIEISSDSLTKIDEIVRSPTLLKITPETFKEEADIDISLMGKQDPHIVVEEKNGPSIIINPSDALNRIAKTLSEGAVKLYSGNHGLSIYQSGDNYTIHHQILPKSYRVISNKI